MASSMACPLIMLSGFKNRAEKTDAIRIISKLRGRFLNNAKNTQAFMMECTHVVCTKPCRREKYLAACASGKWVLSPRYLKACEAARRWLPEDDYQWSNASFPDSDLRTKDLYHAPSRWRAWIVTKGNNPPFHGWKVGLIMPSNFSEAFIRIVHAGGGKAVDISSYYIGANRTSDEVQDELLTHILVIPTLKSHVWRKRGMEGIPHLRSDYLSQMILSAEQPTVKDFSIFKASDSSQGSTSKMDISGFSTTSQTPCTSTPKKSHSIFPLNEATFSRSSAGPGKLRRENKLNESLPATSLSAENTVASISMGSIGSVQLPASTTSTKHLPKKPIAHVASSIPLGSKWKEVNVTNTKLTTASDMKLSKERLFSAQFLETNETIMAEYISKKRQLMSYEGMLNEIIDPENARPDLPNPTNPRPFSLKVMANLEAALEMTFKHSYFLDEFVAHIKDDMYPPADVLYVVMKLLLLDSEDFELSLSTFGALQHVLYLHPPQAKHVKSEKLYHKAFAAVTMPDINESSTLLMAVGESLSRANDNDWKMWTARDPSLGVHWSFYSRVLNIVTRQMDSSGTTMSSLLKFRNAAFLTSFLTDIVVMDYEAIMRRKNLQSSVMKCLIAELLWPTMTGLDPWFRRPSKNLADLVSLYVKAVDNYVERDKAITPDASGVCDRNNNEILLCTSENAMKDIGRLVSITASWCVYCDAHDRHRGKHTCSTRHAGKGGAGLGRAASLINTSPLSLQGMATRTLEHELVYVISTELDNKSMEVIEIALKHLPQRTALEVNMSLIRNNCSIALVDDDIKDFREISLRMITSCLMKILPTTQSEDNKLKPSNSSRSDSRSSTKNYSTSTEKAKSSESSQGARAVKRNNKGETPLHVACIHNHPDMVRYLLNRLGIKPNATDNNGKTALGAACTHGSADCVEVLLSLPLKHFTISKEGNTSNCYIAGGESSGNPWQIDITLCPSNGQTPLHNALERGHFKIACMLLEKGGFRLLDIKDNHKQTPLENCSNQALETSILQYACDISAVEQSSGLVSKNASTRELMPLPSLELYEKALPRKSVTSSHIWRDRVIWLTEALCLLISSYVNASGIADACQDINSPIGLDISKPKVVSTDDLENFAADLIYCYRWKECWRSFCNHLSRLISEDEESVAYVLARCETPIPFELCVD